MVLHHINEQQLPQAVSYISVAATVGYCDKVGKKNGDKEFPNGGTHSGTYNAVILEKGERSQAVRSCDDVIRVNLKTLLGKNRLIIS